MVGSSQIRGEGKCCLYQIEDKHCQPLLYLEQKVDCHRIALTILNVAPIIFIVMISTVYTSYPPRRAKGCLHGII